MKPGRNEPCPCGSGLRYKACCGRLVPEVPPASPAGSRPASKAWPDEIREALGLADAARYTELEAKTRELLRARPTSAVLWQLLGIALGRQGKDALTALTTAAQCSPDDPTAHVNLGNALGRCGRLAEAEASYRRALEINPEFAEAHGNLADLQLEHGLTEEAAASCHRALGIRPGFAAAHRTLAKALVRGREYEAAIDSCGRALAAEPDHAEAHNTLGSALLKLGRFEDAIASLRLAVAISPGFPEAHANLGQALHCAGQLDDAVDSYRRAVALRPDSAEFGIELATALRLQRRSEESEECCRRILALRPDSAAAFGVLAELRADAGRFAEAEAYFREAVALEPDSTDAWAGIARVRRMTAADSDWLDQVERAAERARSPQAERTLRYAIGKYFDDVGDYERAFANYRRANEISGRCGPPHDRHRWTRTIDLIIRSHDAAWLRRHRGTASRSCRPVLVVGMLRSGTTLAEQILASHPQVFGAGELGFWANEAKAAIGAAFATGAAVTAADDATLGRLASAYDDLLLRQSARAARVVDKMPTNFLFLGWIHAALPNARIIHMRRDPLDTCLSIYFQHLEAANTYANDLGDLAHYFGEYRRLMAHWREVLPPDAMLDVPYERLVGDPEAWTRKMLDFVELPWDPACLEFHRTARPVVTASKWQVRQAIATSSVGRWRRYREHLGPLLHLAATTGD